MKGSDQGPQVSCRRAAGLNRKAKGMVVGAAVRERLGRGVGSTWGRSRMLRSAEALCTPCRERPILTYSKAGRCPFPCGLRAQGGREGRLCGLMDKFHLWGQVCGQTLLSHLLPVHDLCYVPLSSSNLPVCKWEFNPFFAGHLGELVFGYVVLPARPGHRRGRSPLGQREFPRVPGKGWSNRRGY